MKFKKMIAVISALGMMCAVVPVLSTENFSAIYASAQESGVITKGTTEDGLSYEIYGTWDEEWDEEAGETKKINISYEYAVITGYSGSKANLTIPAQIQNAPVTEIAGYAFLHNGVVATVKIPDSITAIGPGAFSGCGNLSNVTLSKKLTYIDEGTFSGCSKLVEITIPDSVLSRASA